MKKYILGIAVLAAVISSCEKKIDPVDTFFVTVDYRSGGAKYVTSDVTVNPKDSIYFDFTINSPNPMSYVEIQKNGVRVDTFRLNTSNNKSFSKIVGYRADSAAGDYTYRVVARDARAVFMGDGNKLFTVTVTPDFNFWSYRIMQVPDTLLKVNKCYFSSVDGKAYSYTEASSISSSIDFGYYYDVSGTNRHSFYALTAPQAQISFNDITPWTKNATILKKMPSSVNFVSGLTSAGAIQTLIGGNMTSGTSTKVTAVNTTGGNNVIGFRTASGKFGAILVRYLSADSPNATTQIEVDVKVQK